MPLSFGTRLGHYEILAPIGAGGMGEVYKARDTKLKREVAIKVLPEAFARDPERMARFQREAEVLASLNHPNIAAIYGVEDRALVMELVEGNSPKGPLPFDEAWKIASQIATALEYAHERGVMHRDLKPANVKVTPDGVVKLLDFGLAKAYSNQREPSASPENSPTLTLGATEVGVILGTAAYMAPEQARGRAVDKRADIWSFGVVLYELLTGERLFTGEDAAETLAAVIHKQPDLTKAPGEARRLLEECLQKDPKQRLRDIGDAKRLMGEKPLAQPPLAPRHRSWLPWCIAAFLLLALMPANILHLREAPPQEQPLRASIALPENSTPQSFAISPDGRTLVIAAAVSGKRQLWLRPMDALQAQPMPFTEDATYPFWSPDSRTIGFFAQGKLKKVAASGGPAQSLCDAPFPHGGSWNRDGVILFSVGGSGPAKIKRVAAVGGVPIDVTMTNNSVRHPLFLPDGRHFLYVLANGVAEQTGIYVGSLDGKDNRRVLPDVSSAVFAPPARGGRAGHILFVRESILMGAAFDGATAQVSGDVFPIPEGVSLITNVDNYAPVTLSENGVLLYETGGANLRTNQFGWYDRSGKSLGPVGAPGDVWNPAISPDEKSVVFRRTTGNRNDLWLRDLSRGTETRFTSDPSGNVAPFWSPQGDRIVFASNRRGASNLYQKAASGSGQDELLLPNSVGDLPEQWSRDGRFIVYAEFVPKTKADLWVLPTEGATGDRKPIAFLRTEFNELFGQLSPDSRWMAFTSDRSGRREVYVRPFPPGEGEWTISIAGGEQPRWRGDGKELFFMAMDGKMMAVPVKAAAGVKPSFEAGTPVALFDAHIAHSGGGEYDVTADGKRFLINTTSGAGAASSPPLTVVTNWNAGAKK
jgi:serine/threonine protein kinase